MSVQKNPPGEPSEDRCKMCGLGYHVFIPDLSLCICPFCGCKAKPPTDEADR